MQRDATYEGQRQEYSAKNCLDELVNKPVSCSTSPTFIKGDATPDKKCPHCGEACIVLTSHTKLNPGRKFYRCPNHLEKKFFQWCDDVTPDQQRHIPPSPKSHLISTDRRRDIPESSYPECACGAGICNLATANTERNRGRKYFVCPVKKGQGACNFAQWLDSPGNAAKRDHIEAESTIRPTLTSDNQEVRELTYEDASTSTNLNVLNGMRLSASADKRPEKVSSNERNTWEQTVGFDSGLDDSLLPPIGDLQLSEESKHSCNTRNMLQMRQRRAFDEGMS